MYGKHRENNLTHHFIKYQQYIEIYLHFLGRIDLAVTDQGKRQFNQYAYDAV